MLILVKSSFQFTTFKYSLCGVVHTLNWATKDILYIMYRYFCVNNINTINTIFQDSTWYTVLLKVLHGQSEPSRPKYRHLHYCTRFPLKKILFGLWRSYFHYPDNLQYFNGYALFIARAVGYEPVTVWHDVSAVRSPIPMSLPMYQVITLF